MSGEHEKEAIDLLVETNNTFAPHLYLAAMTGNARTQDIVMMKKIQAFLRNEL